MSRRSNYDEEKKGRIIYNPVLANPDLTEQDLTEQDLDFNEIRAPIPSYESTLIPSSPELNHFKGFMSILNEMEGQIKSLISLKLTPKELETSYTYEIPTEAEIKELKLNRQILEYSQPSEKSSIDDIINMVISETKQHNSPSKKTKRERRRTKRVEKLTKNSLLEPALEQVLTQYAGIADEMADNPNVGLKIACELNDKDLLAFMIGKGIENWDFGAEGACAGSNFELLDLLKRKGIVNLEYCLRGACASGNPHMLSYVMRMLSHTVVGQDRYYTASEYIAFYTPIGDSPNKKDFMDLLETMLKKSTRYYVLAGALRSGNVGLYNYFNPKQSESNNIWKYLFEGACANGSYEIIEYILLSSIKYIFTSRCEEREYTKSEYKQLLFSIIEEHEYADWDLGFKSACKYGQFRVAIKLLPYCIRNNFNLAIKNATENGHYSTVKFLYSKNLVNMNVFHHYAKYAFRTGYLKLINFFFSLGLTQFEINKRLVSACENGDINIVRLVLAKNPTNLPEGVLKALELKHFAIARLIEQDRRYAIPNKLFDESGPSNINPILASVYYANLERVNEYEPEDQNNAFISDDEEDYEDENYDEGNYDEGDF